ncbi:MAG: hypothetical protein KF756_00420 [Acidobacteria bacterium]|nr:hypothetical protein [Acidobacteriota bacterium]
MRSLLALGILSFAVSFCGLADKLKSPSAPSANSANSSAAKPAPDSSSQSDTPSAEKATPSAAQQAIIDGGTETKWDAQGISWKLPAGWKKMDVGKETFNYSSPDNAFLLVNISTLGDNFPTDVSLKAYYDQAIQQMRNGKYESAKMVEIDGIPGVEFVEAPPEGKDDPRRHQWIGYRKYLGQTQMLNVMTSTKASNFSKHSDDFPAILYSMKATK